MILELNYLATSTIMITIHRSFSYFLFRLPLLSISLFIISYLYTSFLIPLKANPTEDGGLFSTLNTATSPYATIPSASSSENSQKPVKKNKKARGLFTTATWT